MTIRKNFNFDEETAYDIEEMAKEENITQTEVMKQAVKLLKQEKKRKKRLQALEKLAGSVPPGSLVDVDIRKARVDRSINRAK